MLVGQSVDDLRYAACRRGVDNGADYSCRYDSRGCDRRRSSDGVIAAASAVIAATTVVAAVDVDVDIAVNIHVAIDVHVLIDVGVAIDVGVVVEVAVLVGAPIDTGLGAAPWDTAASPAAASATSALSEKCRSRDENGDGEHGKDLS